MGSQYYPSFPFFLGVLLCLTSCDIGSEEKCISVSKNSEELRLDTLVLNSPKKNKIYHAQLRFSGEVKDTLNLKFGPKNQLILGPGKYDSLLYEGDWYADPMILSTSGGKGSHLEFCTKFFY